MLVANTWSLPSGWRRPPVRSYRSVLMPGVCGASSYRHPEGASSASRKDLGGGKEGATGGNLPHSGPSFATYTLPAMLFSPSNLSEGEMMRIHLWAATLVLAACLPNTVQSQTSSAAAPVDTVRATPVASAGVEGATERAGVATCHLNFASQFSNSAEVPFPFEPSLVPNGGWCSGDLSCASRCCTHNICVQWP